jgi:hypothetical protein
VLLLAILSSWGALHVGDPSPAAADTVDEASSGAIDSGGSAIGAHVVSGGQNAHRTGAWSPVANWPLSAIHSIVLPNGKVMTYGTNKNGRPSYGFSYDIWDPAAGLSAGSHTTLPVRTATNLFCSAQTVLPGSGRVLITGGEENGLPGGGFNDAVNDVNVYDPSTNALTRLAGSMSHARWYPTVTTLPNGEVLVHGGRDDTDTLRPALVKVYSPASGWRRLTGAASKEVYGAGRWWYPRSWVAPNGKVFIVTKGNRGMYLLDPKGKGAIRRVGTYARPSTNNTTPAAMFDVGKILITRAGGKAAVIDINGATPKVTQTGSLRSYRAWSDATVLANGEVLVTGGASRYQQLKYATNYAEIWNPKTGTWRRGPSARKARLYHSTATLLPDGTVLTAGGGPPGPVVNLNAEIYYPSYLFRQDSSGRLADRPQIAGVDALTWGGSFDVSLGGVDTISKVALVRSGSVTHSFDMGQRFMNLSFTQSGDTLRVHAPANRNIAPPGQYLLFVFDKAGVPSVAQIVELDGTSSSGTTAVQTGSVTLAQRTRGQWVTVGFRQPFTHTPVVSVGAPSNHDAAPVMARVRNVTAHSFDLKLDEWSPLDGRHELETVSYIAAEPGRHRLGGVTLEAGSLTAGSAWRGATFAGAFGAAPVVLPQVASTFDASAVNVRLTAVHAKGFRVRLQVHEAAERAGRRHGEETVHYIALSGGRGTLDGHPIAVGATKVNVTDRWRGISFPRRLASPSLLAADQTAGQLDPVTVRYRALNSSGVMVRMQEEQSYDRETRHGAERVGWVAIGTR